jgi:hypothetical protein
VLHNIQPVALRPLSNAAMAFCAPSLRPAAQAHLQHCIPRLGITPRGPPTGPAVQPK